MTSLHRNSLALAALLMAAGPAAGQPVPSQAIYYAAYPDLPDYAVYGQASLADYLAEFAHAPEFQKNVSRIFGVTGEVSLEERRRMAIGGAAATVTAYEAGGKSYVLLGPEDNKLATLDVGECRRIRCLVGTGEGFSIQIYQSPLPVVDLLLNESAKEAARRACEKALAEEYRSICSGDNVEAAFPSQIESWEKPLPSGYWVDAADGVALSWRPTQADDKSHERAISRLMAAAALPLPTECEDLSEYESQRETLLACGVVRSDERGDEQILTYCLYQGITDAPPKFERCLPLYRRARGEWSVADVSARIIELREPGGDVEDTSCTYESRTALNVDADRLAAAFQPLLGKRPNVRKSGEDTYLLSGWRMNADLRAVNPSRRWAYIKMAVRLQGVDEYKSIISNFSYTVSARPMASSADGRETTQAESGRIGQYFQRALQQALRRVGGREASCESTF